MELVIAAPESSAPVGGPVLTEPQPSAGVVELRYRLCRWCHAATVPTGLLCRVCGSADLAEQRSNGNGNVQRLLPPAQRGHQRLMPYVVTLDEGFAVRAAVVGGLPGAVTPGTRVQLATAPGAGRMLTFKIATEQVYVHLRTPDPAAGRFAMRSDMWEV
ncbi:hypothetical protein [Kitasatospora sp. NBC_00315]|uniref:hypothetical protein n=1 Tax=Kitasatospora sp. NBC_00315 TaxID=2975963 RepID=UPI00324AF293